MAGYLAPKQHLHYDDDALLTAAATQSGTVPPPTAARNRSMQPAMLLPLSLACMFDAKLMLASLSIRHQHKYLSTFTGKWNFEKKRLYMFFVLLNNWSINAFRPVLWKSPGFYIMIKQNYFSILKCFSHTQRGHHKILSLDFQTKGSISDMYQTNRYKLSNYYPLFWLCTSDCFSAACIICSHSILQLLLNPSNPKATFVQITRIQRFLKTFQPCHVGIHWKALAECSQMSTYVPGFQVTFQVFSHQFLLTKLATSSIRVNLKASQRSLSETGCQAMAQ